MGTNLNISNNNIEHIDLIDSHCHLDMDAYSHDLEQVLLRATQAGIRHIITIGINLKSSEQATFLSSLYPNISATIGFHPHDVSSLSHKDYDQMEKLFLRKNKHIVGYGEIGLDYVKGYAPGSLQKHHFREQLALARRLHLPVIIHSRQADDDCLQILKEFSPFEHGGVLHCFSGTLDFAKAVIDLGFLISIPGIVTFNNATTLQKIVRETSLSSMILETDGPFLAPAPFRGKRNEPSYLIYTAQKVAEIKQTSLSEICQSTTQNLSFLFKLNHDQFKNS